VLLQSLVVNSLLIGIMVFLFYLNSYTIRGKYKFDNANSGPSFWTIEVLLSLLFFSIMFGIRYDVGTDHISYLESYIWKMPISKNEPLYNGIVELSHLLNFHYTIYFGIIAFLQISFFFYAFKKEMILFPLLIFFLFTNGEILSWMNIMRQSVAICIWLFSLNYIIEKRFWLYIFWCLVAFLFHRSAIILIVFYPILRNGIDYFKSIPLQLGLLIIAFIMKEIFFDIVMNFSAVIELYTNLLGNEMYENYYNIEDLLDNYKQSGGTGLAYLFGIAVNVLIILYSNKLKKFYNNKRFNIAYFLYFVGILIAYLFPIGFISFTRPFRYLFIFEAIMLAYFCYYLYKSNNVSKRLIMTVVILGYLGIFYLSQIFANADSHIWHQFYFQSKNILHS